MCQLNVGSMMGQCRRRCLSIVPAENQYIIHCVCRMSSPGNDDIITFVETPCVTLQAIDMIECVNRTEECLRNVKGSFKKLNRRERISAHYIVMAHTPHTVCYVAWDTLSCRQCSPLYGSIRLNSTNCKNQVNVMH